MADVVLVQPRVEFMEALKERPAIPLGLLSSCRFLHEDRDIVIIDQRVHADWEARLRREVSKGPLMVGFTAITGRQLLFALEASHVVKDEGEVPVVWGGPHATALPDITLAHPLVDMVVRGEGEETLPALVGALEGGGKIDVPGVSLACEGGSRHNPNSGMVDMDDLLPVPYHLVEMDDYLPLFRGRSSVIFESSRGCPNGCVFCYNRPMFCGRSRSMSAERTVSHVTDLLERYPQVKAVEFVDMNMAADLKRFLDIFKGLADSGHDVEYLVAGVRIDAVNGLTDDDLDLLERTGVKGMLFGVESGSQRVLDLIGKNITVEQVLECNRRLRGHELGASFNFMLGFIGETSADRQRTIELALRILDENPEATTSCFNPVSVYPGTHMHELARSTGFPEPCSLEEWGAYLTDVKSIIARMTWLSHRERLEIERAYVASNFLADTANLIDDPVLRSLAALYRPFARWRLRNDAYGMMPEAWIYHAVRRRMLGP